MANIGDLIGVIKELREVVKQLSPSNLSGETVPAYFATTCPALTVTKFSLPSRCSWVALTAAVAWNYMFSSNASLAAVPVAANTPLYLAGNGPIDLSTLHLHCIAASSGVTVSAWVQKAAPLASS